MAISSNFLTTEISMTYYQNFIQKNGLFTANRLLKTLPV